MSQTSRGHVEDDKPSPGSRWYVNETTCGIIGPPRSQGFTAGDDVFIPQSDVRGIFLGHVAEGWEVVDYAGHVHHVAGSLVCPCYPGGLYGRHDALCAWSARSTLENQAHRRENLSKLVDILAERALGGMVRTTCPGHRPLGTEPTQRRKAG